MVFESLVSDLLNKVIGDYVENLDKSQLKIGIWGGNVVLENLRVKESALSEFDVPFRVKAGQIGKLTLKIPWKNLYNDAVVATLHGLYLLVVPRATIKYDAAKEERYQQEAKQKELQRIEEALQMASRRASQTGDMLFSLEKVVYQEPHHGRMFSALALTAVSLFNAAENSKGPKITKKPKKGLRKLKRHNNETDKAPEEKKDTFMEKLVTQVIKNLQVKISNIHLRYEDDLSYPQCPLSIGVTLSELSLQTTNQNWKACILNEAAKVIYKLGRLDCLCAYWNVNSPVWYKASWEAIMEQLKGGIRRSDQELALYQYIFRPIFSSAKIILTPNAELDLKTPKAQIHLEIKNISVEMTRPQYRTMVELLESIDSMVKNAPYRKFRPDVPVHHSPRVWWTYAFSCILEVHIRRLSHMWSWSKIRQHRQNLKAYKTVYKTKLLSQNKIQNQDTERQIQDLEKVLDVFNITLARQQAHMEVIRSGQKVVARRNQKQGGATGGFFSSWFGRRSKKEVQEESKETESSGLDDLMTAEEKEKLYTTIGYSASSHNVALPKQYVALVVTFQLLRTSVTIREHPDVPEILKVQIIDLSTRLSQRPGAQAFRVEAALKHWFVTGLQQQGALTSLIASVGDSASSLLTVVFEVNPEESTADQLLRVHSQPVEIIYDALTANSLADFFRIGKGIDLEVLTSATLSKLEEMKEKTATGLSHIIETRKALDLRIDLKPSYLLVPKTGFYSCTSDVIIINFGNFQLNSVDQSSSTSSSSLEEIMDRAYERYQLELRRVQVLYRKSGEAWEVDWHQASSVQHILQPVDLTVQLAKCMVEKDARMPRFKVSGELPLLHIKISDEKIHNVLDLINSIPLPNMESSPSTPMEKALPLVDAGSRVRSLHPILLDAMETDSDDDTSERSTDEDHQRTALEDLTLLHFKFEVKEVLLELTQQGEQEKTILSFIVRQLGAEVKMRSFDMSVTSYLRSVALDYCDVPDDTCRLHLISSSECHWSDLLKVEFIKADPSGPSFQTRFSSTEQTLKVEFSSVDFLLHTNALLSTINYLSNAMPPQYTTARDHNSKKQVEKSWLGQTASKGAKDVGVFSFKLFAKLGCFHVEVFDDHHSIADIRVRGADLSVQVAAGQTEVFAHLRDIVVKDIDPNSVHKQVVSIMGEELFSFRLSLLAGETEGEGYSNMSKVDGIVTMRLGCIRIVYLHKFLMSLLMFLDHFQTAKEALSTATEKAAYSVRGLAQKSFRLSMDIRLKAPLIIIPQSSTSQNALLVDLGLITVENMFTLLPVHGFALPAVMDKIEVKLTALKLCRTTLKLVSAPPDIEILQPINLGLLVTRNLAASWFTQIPAVMVNGVLRSLQMSLGEEDLRVLMKILLENIGEGEVRRLMAQEKAELPEQQLDMGGSEGELDSTNDSPTENAVSILLDFEIQEVLLTLKKPQEGAESPFLLLQVANLGINIKLRRYNLCATTYIREIYMKSLEFKDSSDEPLSLVSSSVESGTELLKIQYFRADRSGPNFTSTYKNTKQMINVTFSSLDLVLHTEALLSTISFLSVALSVSTNPSPERQVRSKTPFARSSASRSEPDPGSATLLLPADGDVIDIKVMMSLGAFNVLVCNQTCNMAHIKIQGLNGSLLMQGPQTHISARLRDFIVLNVDPQSCHRKAVSIVGDEVFSFAMSLTPNATEGASYADISRTDGKLKLTVGCIQVVYWHQFFLSLLIFTNHFQTAKEALTAATAQAAEKAASSVRHLAQKSIRLSVDINLKAPLIVIPQSSTSHNALVMDLGLLRVENTFSLLPLDIYPLPAVIDTMEVQLTQLKLSRTCLELMEGGPSIELLEPVNLQLSIKRNLAASWFKEMVPVEIDGDLKPMKMKLSQEDLKMLLSILVENLGETGSLEHTVPRQEVIVDLQAAGGSPIDDVRMPTGASEEEEKGILETLKFNFNFESLGLVLYINDLKQPLDQQHQENLRLGEFTLHLLKASGILTNSSLEVTTILTACTLDDLRTGQERVTSRVLGCRDQKVSEPMIDVTYRQSTGTREVIAVIQNLYLCASVEFLVAVTDFFLQALGSSQSSRPVLSSRVPLKQSTEPLGDVRTSTTYETSKTSKSNRTTSGVLTKVRTVVVDPEVVFVASLMKTDAPALMASFQCDMTLQVQEDGTRYMKANLRSLKILACPFIHSKEDKAVTTVLRPCSVALQTRTHPNQPLSGSVTVEDVMIKISPVILKTLLTISAAMTSTQTEVGNQEPEPNTIDLWSVQNIYEGNYWFLGVDQATEVTESFRNQDGHNQGETFRAEVKVVQLTLESGLGHRTVPLLLAESSFSGSAKNWSSLLKLRAEMTLEVNYFNEVHAVWEPLIERVDGGRRRWNLELEMKNSPVQEESPAHGDHVMILPEPRTAISIWSKDTLNMTVTPSALRVLQNLSKAFSEGTTSTFDSTNNEKAPFTIRNSLGVPLIVQHSANLRPMGAAEAKYHELPVDQTLDLEPSSFERSSRGNLSALQRQESCLFKITIVPSGFSEISNVAIDKPGRHLYNVRGPMLQEVVSVLLQIDAAAGYKFITVRSPLQIINHFSIPFSILEFCPATRSLQIIGEAQPDKEFHIALESYRNQLFVRPAGSLDGQYGPSSTCMAWKEQVHRSFVVRSVIQCPAVGGRLLPLMVSTLAVPDDLRHITNHGEDNWDPAYIIHLHPVATLRNLLPYNIRYQMENTADSFELKEGTTSDLLNARVSGEVVSLVLVSYQGRDWNGHFGIKEEMPEFFSVCLTCDSDHQLAVEVSMHVIQTAGFLLLSLFSPYWIINKTSRVLQYRAEDVSVKHAAECRDIILFSFKKKTLFSKNKLQLCVSNSSWSESFSLDTVGSFGCVRCPAHNMDFLVGVSIHVSSFNLTRIVTISPFFTLVNKSSYELEVGDVTGHGNIRWLYIPSLESSPLWPENSSGTLCLRMVGSDSASKFFFFDRQDSGTLLSLDVCGGIIVDVNITDLSTVISFTNYYEGAAPALLLNHTPWVTISYQQSGSLAVHQLKPGEARRFAWDNPTAVRMLSWSYMEQSGELDLLKDEAGQFSYDSLTQVHWVSFLDGRQRVLLFTEDVTMVTKARQAEELEQFQQEVKVSLKNLGLSLINNTSRKEIAYIGITSSGVVWEMKPKSRWKPFSQKNINLLEQTYQNQLRGETTGAWVRLETNLEVNLGGANMMMRKPFSCQIRRSFLSGILVELKKSQHQRSLRAKLHHLQVDNQLPGAIFPVVFHPVPPPKSIALDSEPKPFIDVSVITRFNRHSSVTQFKYFMVLVQEMAVKLDQGFLAAILAVFTTAADPQACRQKLHLIDRDLELLKTEPMETALNDALGLNFFQNFHISPIKLHLSLSLGDGGCGEEVPEETAALQSFNLLLKSIGATLTDVDDIVFKLAFFEVRYQFYRSEALMWVVLRHYSEQFLKQMYVLVLGLDVLGNPFGLIRGLSQGVEAFFYEPFQGAVQGPEEFAEGFVIGVRSLLGHTVGGAAGMVSRITGSVGKGLAAITMDKEYQQKRREEMNRPPKDFGESLAKGGKGLLKGVVGGVTGIITKPVEGAKKEGAAGFFKGIGKGLVGVVARPTGGIVDMASSTFQGIQRAAELTEEVTKLRPVRVIREDGIIRPYDLTESQGFDLFQHSGIKQLEGEVFRDHYPYAVHQKTTVIITNRRVVCVKQVDFVSHVSREWECLLENLTRPPVISGSGLTIYYKQQKLKFSPRDVQETTRTLQLPDPNTAQKLQTSISDALAAQQQHRMVRQMSQRFLKVKKK